MSDNDRSAMLNEGETQSRRGNENIEDLTSGGRQNERGGPLDVEGVVDTFNPGAVPPNRDVERPEAESPDIEADETGEGER